MPDTVVIAFGGNAILPSGGSGSLADQRANVRTMAAQLGELLLAGYRVVVTHGNGPQVGEIMLRSELTKDQVPPLTLDMAGAMSQGQIGYMLQQEIDRFLVVAGRRQTTCSLVTQVVVERHDPAFQTPTKPIGRFYSETDAVKLRKDRGWVMVEDAGRGYRRVVPSPTPLEIVEWPAIRALIGSDVLTIAAGGGGIPVVREPDGALSGVEAVIDKDLAAERLASLVNATDLVLLTEVENVAVDFGTPRQRPLGSVSLEELKGYAADGQFPEGSMGPKVRAVIKFLESGGRRAVITSAERLLEAVVEGTAGTNVYARAAVPEGSGGTR
jgi:carbamate kinase